MRVAVGQDYRFPEAYRLRLERGDRVGESRTLVLAAVELPPRVGLEEKDDRLGLPIDRARERGAYPRQVGRVALDVAGVGARAGYPSRRAAPG